MHHLDHPIERSLVRVRDARGTIVGAGFLAAPDLVCTCAHVIARAVGSPDEASALTADEVTLDFPFVSAAVVHAVVARWLPIQPTGGGDIAILRLRSGAPAGTAPATLLVAGMLASRKFEVYGIPASADEGRWAHGVVSHRLPTGWVQLEDTTVPGYRVQPGFSGAPVWDPDARGVIGMVVAADQDPAAKTAFMIPASALIEAEPTLDRLTSSGGTVAFLSLASLGGPFGASTPSLPSGTVAFLFTDIPDSAQLWEQHPQAMAAAVARYDALLRSAITAHRGYIFKTVGEAFCAAFATTPVALEAAIDAQRRLAAEPWPETGPLCVRMALHVSDAEERDADYFGRPLNRVARILATGHGCQILLSSAAQALLQSRLPTDVRLLDLGEHRLKDLLHAERIYQVVAPDLPAEFPPLSSLGHARQNLPVQLTPFIGRERQVREVMSLLLNDRARLITLTGPGGIGKTRLALQVAAESSADFADGVWWVPLAPVNDPDEVWTSIAVALGVRERGDEPIVTTLKQHLQDARVLLLLDNFEQVLDASSVVAEHLSACPELRILVTSREALMISGERVYVVPPMELPPKSVSTVSGLRQHEAVRLFIERASEKKYDFALSDANAAAIVEICRQTDGLPLGIELAAARVGYFASLRDLQTRLANRLTELKRKAPDLPERLRTMRASIAWSYNLLTSIEQALFRRLAIFAGGFTLDAAEQVCAESHAGPGDVMDGLESLVDKSLIQPGEAAGSSRYRMLESIREYGLEQLAVSDEYALARSAHAKYYLALAERAEPELKGTNQAAWLDRLEAEHANLRAALEWALSQPDAELALRLASTLRPFWQIRGHLREGFQWLERALAIGPSASPANRAAAHFGLGRLAFDLGDYAHAPGWFETSLALRREVNDKEGIVQALVNLGMAVAARGEDARASRLREEALALSLEMGDTYGIAVSIYHSGNLALEGGDVEGARALYCDALEKMQEHEDTRLVAFLHLMLGVTARLECDGLAAIRSVEESLALFRRVDDKMGIANAHVELGHAARLSGDDEQAERLYKTALSLFQEAGSEPGMVEGLEALAAVAAAQGQPERAAVLIGAASKWRAIVEHPFFPPADRTSQEAVVEYALQTHAEAFSAGRAMSLERAAEEGLTTHTVARSAPSSTHDPA